MSKMIDYLNKEAGSAAGEGLEAMVGLLPYLIGVPAAGGALVGYTASKATSPGMSDREDLQQKVMDVKVREELALQQRRLEALRKRLREGRENKPSSRKRDMFV